MFFPLLFRNCGVTHERDASPYLVLSGRFVVHGKQRAQTVGRAIMQLERCTRTLLNMRESVRETGHRSQQLLSCRYSSVATNAQAPTRSGVPSVSTYFLLLFCVTKVCLLVFHVVRVIPGMLASSGIYTRDGYPQKLDIFVFTGGYDFSYTFSPKQ